MLKYTVRLTRPTYDYADVAVEATSHEEAEAKALTYAKHNPKRVDWEVGEEPDEDQIHALECWSEEEDEP